MIANVPLNVDKKNLLSRVKDAIYNGESHTKTDLDALKLLIVNDPATMAKVEASKELVNDYGSKRRLRKAVEAMMVEQDEMVKTLAANRNFKQEIAKKPGILKRVGSYFWKHKVLSALLMVAALAGGTAAGYYLTGKWSLLMSGVGAARTAAASAVADPLQLLEAVSDPMIGTAMEAMPGGTPFEL